MPDLDRDLSAFSPRSSVSRGAKLTAASIFRVVRRNFEKPRGERCVIETNEPGSTQPNEIRVDTNPFFLILLSPLEMEHATIRGPDHPARYRAGISLSSTVSARTVPKILLVTEQRSVLIHRSPLERGVSLLRYKETPGEREMNEASA